MIKINDCIFCKIASGKMDSEKIYETEKVVSFLDINPLTPGHSLVIPKKHVEVFSELEDELVGEVFKVTKRVEKALDSALNPDGFTIGINDGKAAGQEIPHLHINILPRFKNDRGGSIHTIVKNPPEEEISEIAEKVKKSIQETRK